MIMFILIFIGKKVTKNVTTSEFLQETFKRKTSLKEKELELKNIELDLQQRKWAVEEEEWKKRLEMEAEKIKLESEERRAMIDLLKKLAK